MLLENRIFPTGPVPTVSCRTGVTYQSHVTNKMVYSVGHLKASREQIRPASFHVQQWQFTC